METLGTPSKDERDIPSLKKESPVASEAKPAANVSIQRINFKYENGRGETHDVKKFTLKNAL
jgi:hypothetical protein